MTGRSEFNRLQQNSLSYRTGKISGEAGHSFSKNTEFLLRYRTRFWHRQLDGYGASGRVGIGDAAQNHHGEGPYLIVELSTKYLRKIAETPRASTPFSFLDDERALDAPESRTQ